MENESFGKLKDKDRENGQAALERKVCVSQPLLGCLDAHQEKSRQCEEMRLFV